MLPGLVKPGYIAGEQTAWGRESLPDMAPAFSRRSFRMRSRRCGPLAPTALKTINNWSRIFGISAGPDLDRRFPRRRFVDQVLELEPEIGLDRSSLPPFLDRLVSKFYPDGRMVARVLPPADMFIDLCLNEPLS